MDARADFRRGGVSVNNEELSIATGCAFVSRQIDSFTPMRQQYQGKESVSDLGRGQVIYLSRIAQ